MSSSTQKPTAFYDDLEKLLQDQISKQPQLLEYRLKLAELYFETRRKDDFLRQARQMQPHVRHPEKSDEWARVVSMGRMIAADDAMFALGGGDTIAFIAPKVTAAAPAYTRIGDEERFRKPLEAIAEAYEEIRKDPRFMAELDMELIQAAGHPSSLQPTPRLSAQLGGAQIFLKREDIHSRSSHLLAAVVGQALLAKRMGKKTLVASTPNGRSGVVIASVAARLGMDATIFMDAEQMRLQTSNVFRMWLMGANVTEADTSRHLKADIRKAAWDHWATNTRTSFLVKGLDAAPHPYPMMTLEFASVTGREVRRQLYANHKKVPDLLVARAGDNPDAIGFFPPFLKAPNTRLACVEGQEHLIKDADTKAAIPGSHLSLHEQQRVAVILEGMDYPRVTREHAWLKASGRVEYVKTTAKVAKDAVSDLARYEGIIPAIQTAYALGWACEQAAKMKKDQTVVVMMSENVDKNIWEIGKAMGVPL